MATDPQTGDADSISQAGSTRNDRKRNLVNQRNFRSRRKQYIEELEGKVQAYERQGVAASQQVQDAARALIAENEALRHIIFQQLGWRPEYLHAVISQSADPPPQQQQQQQQQQRSVPATRTGDPLQHTLSARQYEPVQRIKEEPRLSSLQFATNGYSSAVSQRPREHDGDQYRSINGTMDYPIDETGRMGINGPPREISRRRDGPNVHSRPTTIGDNTTKAVMSCEHAASILAELRAQGTVDTIRAELGCKSTEACDVRHEVVFERMDRAV